MDISRLLEFDNIIIQCHNFPDADTIAAGYAMYRYFRLSGKNPRLVYCGSRKISKPDLMMLIEELNIPLEYVEEPDCVPQLLLNVDCVYGESNVTPWAAENYAAVDHHRSAANSPFYGSELYDIRPGCSSCSSIIAHLLRSAGFDPNDDITVATALYYGLYTDTGGLIGLSQGADRDLRDFTEYDREIISQLTNSNLSLEELRLVGKALTTMRHDEKIRFGIAQADGCDPNMLGLISDLILQVNSVDFCVVCALIPSGVKISVRSCLSDVSAADVARVLTSGIGSGGGGDSKAGGLIGYCPGIFNEGDNPMDFIHRKISDFYESFEIIHCNTIPYNIDEMHLYRKRRKKRGYVRSTDILPAGTVFYVRSRLNDLKVKADDSVYIMMTETGITYTIEEKKLYSSYNAENMPFRPEVEYPPCIIDGHNRIALMPFLRSCLANPETTVYAKELTRCTKLFTSLQEDKFMLGKEGDFLVMRKDDMKDMYISPKVAFMGNYDLV